MCCLIPRPLKFSSSKIICVHNITLFSLLGVRSSRLYKLTPISVSWTTSWIHPPVQTQEWPGDETVTVMFWVHPSFCQLIVPCCIRAFLVFSEAKADELTAINSLQVDMSCLVAIFGRTVFVELHILLHYFLCVIMTGCCRISDPITIYS